MLLLGCIPLSNLPSSLLLDHGEISYFLDNEPVTVHRHVTNFFCFVFNVNRKPNTLSQQVTINYDFFF